MLTQHRSHIASTCSTIQHHLEEVRTAITAGKSPGGAALTPLPEPGRTRLLKALDSLSAGMDDLARKFASQQQTEQGASGPSATRMWVSILLRTCEELLGDLLPARMEMRYGPLSQSEEAALSERVTGVLTAAKAALDLSDSL